MHGSMQKQEWRRLQRLLCKAMRLKRRLVQHLQMQPTRKHMLQSLAGARLLAHAESLISLWRTAAHHSNCGIFAAPESFGSERCWHREP